MEESSAVELLENRLIVVLGKKVFRKGLALEAAMHDHPAFFTIVIKALGLHQSATASGSIAGHAFVEMHGIKALGAMISAASRMRRHLVSTISTLKAFVDHGKLHAAIMPRHSS